MLVEHALRHDAEDMEQAILIQRAGRLNPDETKELEARLENQRRDILDLAEAEHDYSGIKKLKNIMNKEGNT